jgi:glycosyltransferase involved in cell wall biosynthesis
MGYHPPPVSIGIPVYNGERYLALALDSHLRQTFTDFELILCDNASTDRTEEICRAYAARDPRIRYVRHESNLGAAKNYRLAFELSSGRYFKWATYDDLCAPEFLKRLVQVLDEEPSVVLAYARTKLIDESGQVTTQYEDNLHLASTRPSERFKQLLQQLRLCNALYGLIRADALRQTALLANFIASDIPLLAELTLYGKFWEIPEFLFFRRIHPEAGSNIPREDLVLEFYDPKSKGRVPFTEWRHFGAHVRAASRAPLSMPERIRLAALLLQIGIKNRGKLALELTWGMRKVVWKLRKA